MRENKKAVILLSGGLDSLVSLVLAKKICDVDLALTFDYGQKALEDEISASAQIAEFYNVKHKVIELPFLKDITNNALTNPDIELGFENLGEESAQAVWVPNRNGLFINIAASYADAFKFDYIIIGANKEEAETFSDNSAEFIEAADNFFLYSTGQKPRVLAPLCGLEKYEIINEAVKNNVELRLLKSCYNSSMQTNKRHCGECESCKRLKSAILKSLHKDLINLFF